MASSSTSDIRRQGTFFETQLSRTLNPMLYDGRTLMKRIETKYLSNYWNIYKDRWIGNKEEANEHREAHALLIRHLYTSFEEEK